MEQYITRRSHDDLGLGTVHLAVVMPGTKPVEDQWIPAYRDMMDDQPVVWIRSAMVDGELWIKDDRGERRAKRWP